MARSPCCSKEGLKRGAWTAVEDKILRAYVKVHGEGKWRTLPQRAGLKRCGKSCRLRWLNYLRPDIKRGNISRDEEELIIRLHKLLGNRWSLIAGRLPGRTDSEIKNYWNTTLGKKAVAESSFVSPPSLSLSGPTRQMKGYVRRSEPEAIKTISLPRAVAARLKAIRTKAKRCIPIDAVPESIQNSELSTGSKIHQHYQVDCVSGNIDYQQKSDEKSAFRINISGEANGEYHYAFDFGYGNDDGKFQALSFGESLIFKEWTNCTDEVMDLNSLAALFDSDEWTCT